MKTFISCVVMALGFLGHLHAQVTIKSADGKKVIISANKGDPPPPGPYARLSAPIARVIVRELLNKRKLVSTEDSCIACGVPFLETKFYGTAYFETKDLKISKEKISFNVDQVYRQKRSTLSPAIDLKWSDYAHAENTLVYGTGKGFSVKAWSVLTWEDPADAAKFAQAINVLIYEAHRTTAEDDLVGFGSQAAQMRSAGQLPPDGWDKYRIIAEQAVKDADYIKAIINYEDGVTAYPLWAEGWFNAALIYDGLKEYEFAANRMRHYLILMPDAPDSKVAREKIVIWDDKAKQ